MDKPKISIITVCYNSEAHLEEAMLSIINQSYANKEYIVIDGSARKEYSFDNSNLDEYIINENLYIIHGHS